MNDFGGETRLHLVDDDAGRRVSFGDVQAAWLVEKGLITLVRFEQTAPAGGVNFYRSTMGETAEELNDLVVAQPQLRQCDFCQALPALWRLKVHPFFMQQGPAPGWFRRDAFCCELCVELVKAGDKAALMDRAIVAAVEEAHRRGGALGAHVAGLSPHQIKAGLLPLVKESVHGIVGNRDGWPVKDGEAEAA